MNVAKLKIPQTAGFLIMDTIPIKESIYALPYYQQFF